MTTYPDKISFYNLVVEITRRCNMKVEGRFIATVFARNAEAAIDQAVKQYQDADFGELERK